MAKTVEVDRIGKRYRLGEDFSSYLTLRESLTGWARRRTGPPEDFWALRDISFDVAAGETLGIIGRNGAGKTTLLRILARITQPTEGVSRSRGRIGTLLDVGTGFHPELTGRENVFLNGAILGLSTAETKERFDDIVEFAGVGTFIDTPVKRFSSGMRLRLAFAVAAHLNPEIVLVDEVLAVGDVAFQRKCMGRMEDVARQGRTVVFVSHSMGAIESLCDRVLWIEKGRVRADAAPAAVIPDYLRAGAELKTVQSWEAANAPGNDDVRLRRAHVYPDGKPDGHIDVHTPIALEFEYENLRQNAYLNLSLHLYSAEGFLVLNGVPVGEGEWFGRPFPAGRFRDRCVIPGDLLNNGSYRVELLVVRDRSKVIYRDSAILEFDVADSVSQEGFFDGEWAGVVRPRLDWATERLR